MIAVVSCFGVSIDIFLRIRSFFQCFIGVPKECRSPRLQRKGCDPARPQLTNSHLSGAFSYPIELVPRYQILVLRVLLDSSKPSQS